MEKGIRCGGRLNIPRRSDRYKVKSEERAKAEKTALDYVKAWDDVGNPEIKSTRVVYVWKWVIIPPPPKDAEYDIFDRGRKCLQVTGSFNWVNGDGSFIILVDLADWSIRGYSSSAGKMRLDIPELYHLAVSETPEAGD